MILLEFLVWSIIVTIFAGTTKMKKWILCIKITDKAVPQSCFNLIFNISNCNLDK